MGSSVTTRRKSWEKVLILGSYLKFRGQNLGYLSFIFLEAKFEAPTRISEAKFGAKSPDLLICKYPPWKLLLDLIKLWTLRLRRSAANSLQRGLCAIIDAGLCLIAGFAIVRLPHKFFAARFLRTNCCWLLFNLRLFDCAAALQFLSALFLCDSFHIPLKCFKQT